MTGRRFHLMVRLVMFLGLTICLTVLLISALNYFTNSQYIKYATIFGGSDTLSILREQGDLAFSGLVGSIISLVVAFCLVLWGVPMAGLGIVVDRADTMTEQLSGIEKK